MGPIGTKVLEDLKKVGLDFLSPAFVAGGYLRDEKMGIPFKDIDIFVPLHESMTIYDLLQDKSQERYYKHLRLPDVLSVMLSGIDHGSFRYFAEEGGDTYGGVGSPHGGAFSVFSSVYKKSIPVQLIFYKYQSDPISELFETFDFEINKIYSDGLGVNMTPEAERDYKLRLATLVHAESMEDYMKSYERYLSWKSRGLDLQFNSKVTFYSQTEVDRLLERERNLQENNRARTGPREAFT